MTRPIVVIGGLGPAGPEHITAAVAAAIDRIPHRYVRTTRHPSVEVAGAATSFDDLYDSSPTFDAVYRAIADRLADAAREHGEVLYLVPGSPLVLEQSVRHLLADERVRCDLLPSLSFLDLAYARLGIDPIEAGVRLIDGHDFARAAAGERGPLLVAHCHANWVLSDIKLAVEDAAGDERVVILQRLGGPDEVLVETTWAELDRTVDADHLTSVYIPRLAAPVGGELVGFHQIVRRLRTECPWDRVQTHETLARYAVEETYELVEAIGALGEDGAGDDELVGELGDVLLQVVLHAAIAEEGGRFNLADVARTISEKMVRRHPHVFGDVEVESASDVARNWQQIKAAEKAAGGATVDEGDGSGDGAGAAPAPIRDALDAVSGSLPALLYARELGVAAAKYGFDWDDPRGTLDKVAEELDEVRVDFEDHELVGHELGDLLFAVVSVARHRQVDPEVALRRASAKFKHRVAAVERLAASRGIDVTACGLEGLEELWDEVKRTGI